jgi:Domain of unknown function (DUF4383)
MSSHIPVNHRLRPWYRLLAGLAGVYVLVFGIIGVIRTGGDPVFHRGGDEVFGLKSNLAFAVLSIIAGVVIVAGAVIGRNIDHYVNLIGGVLFLVAGMLMMALLQTDANFLNFQMATCVVSFVIGVVLFVAGLYGRVGDEATEAHEDDFRLHHGTDPDRHKWAFKGGPPRPSESHPDGQRFA